jgi:hypothetical protein
MLKQNPGLLQRVHLQSDLLTTRLDLIHFTSPEIFCRVLVPFRLRHLHKDDRDEAILHYRKHPNRSSRFLGEIWRQTVDQKILQNCPNFFNKTGDIIVTDVVDTSDKFSTRGVGAIR